MRNQTRIRLMQSLPLIMVTFVGSVSFGGDTLQFNRDVRPILSNNCFQCHGPDETHRKADLRLDQREGVELAFGDAGLEASDAWERINSDDPDLRMPPPDSKKELTPHEIQVFQRWIEQGAKSENHWSFVTPRRPAIPRTKFDQWVVNPIDAFIAQAIERQGLTPSPPADRARWLRRVTFDLIGLPPTLDEIDAFVKDPSENAYEAVVDRLLDSNHFGERMALAWMDAARYGDTSVYHADGPRDMWPWRDWVIRAYNSNMPFDQFTVEQLAGDLLPNPTIDQRIAAGFHRNHGTTDEGGAIDEEYRVEYLVDRVKTTSTVWMGLTMECAQCHDHKYDPISQEEYYQFYAYFNQSSDKGMQTRNGNAEPRIDVFDPINSIKQHTLRQSVAELEKQRDCHLAKIGPAFEQWHQQACAKLETEPFAPDDMLAHFTLNHDSGTEVSNQMNAKQAGKVQGQPRWVAGQLEHAFRCDATTYLDLGNIGDFERSDPFSLGAWIYPEGKLNGAPLARMDDGNAHRGYDVYLTDGRASVHIIHRWPEDAIKVTTTEKLSPEKWQHLMVTYDGSSQASGVAIYVDGQPQALTFEVDGLKNTIKTDKALFAGRRNPGSSFTGIVDDIRLYPRQLTEREVQAVVGYDPIRPLLRIALADRTEEQSQAIRQYYLEQHDETYIGLKREIDELSRQVTKLAAPVSTVMTMRDVDQPRMTYVLNRGSYDAPMKDRPVNPGTLQALPPLPPDAPQNRLGLANWIVSGHHPLTARVAVNRYWSLFFGEGLVRTLGDFGSQGEWPTHPELLDWLAQEFVESDWNIKHLIRQIVTSATYRQSSRATAEQRLLDPENRWLGRGPRFRLQGEFIRDNALAASGLLVNRVGGPSTKPYQPAGLWNEVSLSGDVRFVQDHGEKLYRRSMYIYWKRSAPMPVMTIFDAPSREKCIMRRSRTNTPLQALVTLNDPQFVEAARVLAGRCMSEGGEQIETMITQGYRLATGCHPSTDTLRLLVDAYDEELGVFAQQPARAEKLLAIGESKRSSAIDLPQHAAMTIVMSLILNLDETLTRG